MKRLRFIIAVLLCLVLLAIIMTGLFGSDPHAPQFVLVQTQPTGPFKAMHYDWNSVAPVRDGKVWFWTVPTTTNRYTQHFLYELKSRRVVGELLNASPIFFNADQTKILCDGYSARASLKWKLIRWLEKSSFGKGLSRKLNYDEAFWLLDLRNNSAVRIGKVTQGVGLGSSFRPSPGFRYGYNEPSTVDEGVLFLCDLESNRFVRIKVDGEPLGWWDEQKILFKDKLNNFNLFDVTTHRTNIVFAATTISRFLQELGLPDDSHPGGITALCHWNGRDNDILFTEYKEKNWGTSFLLKADRKDLSLRLLYRDFKFQWGGHLDSDCIHYVYEGESGQPGRGGNGGVYLRNLTNNTTLTLVEPDNGGAYSLMRFCDDGVIYSRKRLLWRVDLNGSNNAPLIRESPR
jgi:hypothetical protein